MIADHCSGGGEDSMNDGSEVPTRPPSLPPMAPAGVNQGGGIQSRMVESQQPFRPNDQGNSGEALVICNSNNVPIVPSYLFPLDAKGKLSKTLVTKDWVIQDKVWQHAWILDDLQYKHRRTVIDRTNPDNQKRIIKCIENIINEFTTQGNIIASSHMAGLMGNIGFRVRNQVPSNLKHIKEIIESPTMKKCHNEDYLYPFGVIHAACYASTVYSKASGDQGWLYAGLRRYANYSRVKGRFDFRATPEDGKKEKHTLLKAGFAGISGVKESLANWQESAFNMSLRTTSSTKKDYWTVPVTLPDMINDIRQKTYLLVSKKHYPYLSRLVDGSGNSRVPDEGDLANTPRDRISTLAHCLAHELCEAGMGMNQGLTYLQGAHHNISQLITAPRAVTNTDVTRLDVNPVLLEAVTHKIQERQASHPPHQETQYGASTGVSQAGAVRQQYSSDKQTASRALQPAASAHHQEDAMYTPMKLSESNIDDFPSPSAFLGQLTSPPNHSNKDNSNVRAVSCFTSRDCMP